MSDTILPEAKACNTCGVVKPLDQYRRKSRNKDGHFPKCKDCMKAGETEAQRERARQRANDWYKANPERVYRNNRKWAKANPQKVRASQRRYGTSQTTRDQRREWIKANPEMRRAWALRYYLKNKDKYRAYQATRRALVRGTGGKHTPEDIKMIARRQGMKCIYCRKSLKPRYHVDHVLPLVLGGSNDKGNLQLLCPQCNLSKGSRHPIEHANRLGMLL
jgi:5-methylcytosine-specific restriction endonuclease McrA